MNRTNLTKKTPNPPHRITSAYSTPGVVVPPVAFENRQLDHYKNFYM
jgi:hypothetical protein